jgi:uroporphyrin-III C-methyltransferase / precorrin-2 dehydrogenase / sirohydrochlorin ferrochelatase
MAQPAIGALMVGLARQGRRVLRLKGGDPLLFGRGGEELQLLTAHGIRVRVVPGITAAVGCAAYAGLPLTHREHADACLFVTGHRCGGRLDLDWQALLRPRQTVAIYMGLRAAARIAREMIARGAAPGRPAAIIVNGTRPGQRVLTTTLAGLPAAARTVAAGDVGLIVIGEVVGLARALAWFGAPPEPQAPRTAEGR